MARLEQQAAQAAALDSRLRGNDPPEADRGFGGVPQLPNLPPKNGGQGVENLIWTNHPNG